MSHLIDIVTLIVHNTFIKFDGLMSCPNLNLRNPGRIILVEPTGRLEVISTSYCKLNYFKKLNYFSLPTVNNEKHISTMNRPQRNPKNQKDESIA